MASFAKTSALLSLLSVFASALNFAAQLAIARTFGASEDVDAYFWSNSLPMLVGGLIAGAMAYQIVPMIIHAERGSCDTQELRQALLFKLMRDGGLLVAVGAIVSWLCAIWTVTGSGFLIHHAQWMALIAWVGAGAGMLTALFTAFHHVNRCFLLPAVVNLLPPLLSLAACGWINQHGGKIFQVACAVAAGQLLATLLLVRKLYLKEAPARQFAHASQYVGREMKSLPLVMLSMLAFTCFPAVDALWGVVLGDGGLAMLGYGQRIIIAIAGVAVNGSAVLLMPRLSEFAAAGEQERLLSEAVAAIKGILLIISPIAIATASLAEPTISVFFEGGKFDTGATLQLAELLRFMLIGMLPMATCTILFRAHYARRDRVGAAWIGSIGAITYFTLSGISANMHFGLAGFGGAYFTTWLLVSAASTWRLWKRRPAVLLFRNNVPWILRVMVALSASTLVAVVASRIAEGRYMQNACSIDMAGLIARYLAIVLAFLSAAMAVGVPEVRIVVRALLTRIVGT